MGTKIEYVDSSHMYATNYIRNSKAIAVLWAIFTICYAIIGAVAFLTPGNKPNTNILVFMLSNCSFRMGWWSGLGKCRTSGTVASVLERWIVGQLSKAIDRSADHFVSAVSSKWYFYFDISEIIKQWFFFFVGGHHFCWHLCADGRFDHSIVDLDVLR